MFISKENVNKVIEELKLDDFVVYVDMKFFLKDICNPYRTSDLRYMDKLSLHQYFIDLHNIMTHLFKKPVHFVYSTNMITIEDMPNYKAVYYSKYFGDEDREEILAPIKSVFDSLKFSSITSGEEKFIDSSDTTLSQKDEFGFIKVHHGDKKALVITRDKIFDGYDDMVTVDPYELSSGELKPKKTPEYHKIVLSIAGYEEYSLYGVPGVKEKTVDKIIKKILDSEEYIYYNSSSKPQVIFPISYETLSKVSDITREEYEKILVNWRLLN